MLEEQEKETQQTEEGKPQEEGAPQEAPQEEIPEGEKPEKSKELQSALAQKEHFRDKAEKAEKELESLKKEKPSESAPTEEKDEWKSKVEFLLQNQEKKYSETEFDHISVVATQKGIGLDEAAKQVDSYIQFERDKVETAKKVPGSTAPGAPVHQKSWKDIQKFGIDAKGKAEFRDYVEKMEKESTGM